MQHLENVQPQFNQFCPFSDSGQIIAQNFITASVFPSTDWTSDIVTTPRTEQHIKFRFRCTEHYYGDGCDVRCRPRDDKFGHELCLDNGTKICMTGWKGRLCDQRKLTFDSVSVYVICCF